ncbi:transcriptional regulator, GntR family [Friedmanniella luteola]|uniref:Transcriptional regulator, GntR family n=1 Tax=Friedmanniella luteola TaxID=546871 RepID=A0A1H1ZFN1_9ACTN|nr:GntR family transcriptional regulator [Friedmanniella luteola]SDT32524.1 transcriptional regulator, GntR family [Friedmanniella luteola]
MRESGASMQTYRQLVDALRHGVFAPGARLPAERVLAARFGVSRVTVRNALRRLAEEGRLESVLGSGWFVAPQVVGEPPSVLQTFSEMARARGLRPTARVLAQHVRPATLGEADQLGTAPAAEVLEVVRLRGMDETVICLDESVLPLAVAAGLVDVDLTDRSLYAELEERCGLRIERSAYAVRAEVADATLAGQLGVEVGWPVLVGAEVGYVEGGRPVLLGTTHYRGDSYRFQADLFRPR